MRDTLRVRRERAILVGAVFAGNSEKSDGLIELAALAESAGAIVVDKFQQKIHKINAATYIGKGKTEQLAGRVIRFNADVIIFDNDLTPSQIREIETIVKTKVLDRSELILDIFATRAQTKQAKLQVSLAQLEYTYPRLTKMWQHLDSVAGAGGGTTAGAVGAVGTRGTGEQQLEIDRRLVKKSITELKRQLQEIDKRKIREIDARRGSFKACLVGYTNSGKSTLLNTLTGADAVTEDRLFATLDTKTKKWMMDGAAEVLLSDTVGFVRNLPHQLVASFKATLEEAVNADMLLHIVDAANPNAIKQIEAVRKVLAEIGCGDKPVMEILNKVDVIKKIGDLELLQTLFPDAVCISAKTGFGLDVLKNKIMEKYRGTELLLRVTSPQSNGKAQSFMRAYGRITKEDYSGDSVIIEVNMGRNHLAGLQRLGIEKIEIIESRLI